MDEPSGVTDSLASDENEFWRAAIESEVRSLQQNGTWRVVTIPDGVKALQTRFVFKKKKLQDGAVGRFKARLVVKGYLDT